MLRSEHGRIGEVLRNALIGRPLEHSQHATHHAAPLHALSRVFLALEVAPHHHAEQRNRHAASHIDRVRQLRKRLADVVLRHAVLITHVQLVVALVHAELRDAEVAPARRLRREVAHPRHNAVEVAVVHATARRVVQVHHVIEVGQLPVHPGVRQLQQLRVRRRDGVGNALERGEREEEPEVLGEDERVGREARTGDSVAVEEREHLDGLVGDEEPHDRRLQQVLVVLLHGRDGRLVVVGDHEAVGRRVDDRFQRENVRVVRLDGGFEVVRQLAFSEEEASTSRGSAEGFTTEALVPWSTRVSSFSKLDGLGSV